MVICFDVTQVEISGSPSLVIYAPIMDFDWAAFVEDNQNNRSLLGDWAEFNVGLMNKSSDDLTSHRKG